MMALEVKVSPDGKFLYSSQRRDDNTIGIYAIDQQTGQLTVMGLCRVVAPARVISTLILQEISDSCQSEE